jgi:hypothetical protein
MWVPLSATVFQVFEFAGPPMAAGFGPRWRTLSSEEVEDKKLEGRIAEVLTVLSLLGPFFTPAADLLGLG